MDPEKLNNNIYYSITTLAGVLAVLMGVSVYWRTPVDPSPSKAVPTSSSGIVLPPNPANAYHFSGQAYNKDTNQVIANNLITWPGQQKITTDRLMA